MADKENLEENEDENDPEEWSTRKSADFIVLSEITPEDRTIIDCFVPVTKFENMEKIQFKCQPINKDPSHISMDDLTKKSPVKEIIYRLLVNHKRSMKLADIISKTRNIIKDRRLSTHDIEGSEYRGFYSILKNDTYYGFKEVE